MIAHFSISAILLLVTWFFYRASQLRIADDQLNEMYGAERSPWPSVVYVGIALVSVILFCVSLMLWFVAAVRSIVV